MCKWKSVLLFTFSLLPPFAIFFFIISYSINIPYMDQWTGSLELISNMKSGLLKFHYFWSQHNEHRLFFPKIIMLFLSSISHWNVIWEQLFSLFIQILTLLLIFSLAKETIPTDRNRSHVFFKIFSSILLFSMVQQENWSWGWQLQIFLNILAVIFTIWSITKWPDNWMGLLLGALGATVATYSFANGILIWIVFLFLLPFRMSKWRTPFILLWIIIASGIFFSYIYHYKKPAYHPSLLSLFENPLNFLAFFFSYLGSPFGISYGLSGSVLFGILGIGILFFLLYKICIHGSADLLKKSHPWIGLVLYILLSAILTGIGRSGFSAYQALSSRYTSFSIIFWVAISALAIAYNRTSHHSLVSSSKSFLSIIIIVFSFLIFSHSLSYAKGLIEFKNHFARLSRIHLLLKYKRIYGAGNNFAVLFPSMTKLFKNIETLRELKLGPFYKEITEHKGIYLQGSYIAKVGIPPNISRAKYDMLELDKNSRLSLPIEIPDSGQYELWIEPGFAKYYGFISVIVDNKLVGETDCNVHMNMSSRSEFFKRLRLGVIFLSKGLHTLTLTNKKGPNLINSVSFDYSSE